MSAPAKVLVVDDEPLVRERLLGLLRGQGDLQVIAEATHGAQAVELISTLQPQVVFLDVQMPGMGGLEVVRAVGPAQMPLTVFVTAHAEHAVRAFELAALDYLLKPIDGERFAQTLERLRARLRDADTAGLHARLRGLLERAPTPTERVLVAERGALIPVRWSEVEWLEAAGNYVTLHTGAGSHLLRESLTALLERDEARGFVRIHRSVAVAIAQVSRLVPEDHGTFTVVLREGKTFTSGPSHRAALLRALGG